MEKAVAVEDSTGVVRGVGMIFTSRKFLKNDDSTDDARTSGLRVGKTTNDFFGVDEPSRDTHSLLANHGLLHP